MNPPAYYDHLLEHAQRLFPGARIEITYTDDEMIQIDVDQHRYTFEKSAATTMPISSMTA